MVPKTIENRQDLLERLNSLIKFLATRTNDRNGMNAKLEAEIALAKAKYEPDLTSAGRDIADTIAQIRKIIEENRTTVFTDKSVKLLYGVIASRKVGGGEKLDQDRLLALARKLGIVRKFFRPRVVQELDTMDLRLYTQQRPEHKELIDDCYDIDTAVESVTVKLALNAPGIDTSQLTSRPIPICKIVVDPES
ncbi:host-nuclease inhibitor Gam family protein [Patescibacteria group bacterium]|nr:host-nuclease inhibitor Gam family protein [Patescibacteria group bacterium]